MNAIGSWNWGAVGKLPAAGDFFQKGDQVPMLDAFAHWIQTGFGQVALMKKNKPETVGQHRSWRFWAAGIRKHELVCGLSRDSSDSLGRPYPLLMLGQGVCKGWQQHWEQIPLILGKAWSKMEYIAAQDYQNLDEFWNALKTIGNEALESPNFQGKNDFFGPVLELRLQKHLKDLQQNGRTVIPMDTAESGNPESAAFTWHQLLANRLRKLPRAVFMGGTLEQSFIVICLEPLTIEDFIELWTGPKFELDLSNRMRNHGS